MLCNPVKIALVTILMIIKYKVIINLYLHILYYIDDPDHIQCPPNSPSCIFCSESIEKKIGMIKSAIYRYLKRTSGN